MKNTFTLFVAILIAGIMLVYMFCFRVRYDQAAIVTTFGAATASSVRTDPALYLRWPWPFQRVRVYNTNVQIMEDRLQQQLTADNKNLVVKLFMAWRIKDPHKFYLKKLYKLEDADPHLHPFLKDAHTILSQYRFDQFVNTDASKLALPEIEEAALQHIASRLKGDGGDSDFGIEVLRVGIQRIMLPQTTTDKVFERMKESRLRLAQEARSEGKARADAIKAKATSASQQILAFAERSAAKIRTKGDEEAAASYAPFREDPEFAIFIRKIETLVKILPYNNTYILNPQTMPSLGQLFGEPTGAPATQDATQ